MCSYTAENIPDPASFMPEASFHIKTADSFINSKFITTAPATSREQHAWNRPGMGYLGSGFPRSSGKTSHIPNLLILIVQTG